MKHVERGITESEAERETVWPTANSDKGSAMPVYDPTKPLNFKFKLLQEYNEQYEKLKSTGEIQKYRENIE